jgi:hypothetical protein
MHATISDVFSREKGTKSRECFPTLPRRLHQL